MSLLIDFCNHHNIDISKETCLGTGRLRILVEERNFPNRAFIHTIYDIYDLNRYMTTDSEIIKLICKHFNINGDE